MRAMGDETLSSKNRDNAVTVERIETFAENFGLKLERRSAKRRLRINFYSDCNAKETNFPVIYRGEYLFSFFS